MVLYVFQVVKSENDPVTGCMLGVNIYLILGWSCYFYIIYFLFGILQAERIECCDVDYMADKGIAEVKLRACMKGEMLA